MHIQGRGERLTVFVDENDQFGHHPLYTEIVQRARRAGLAGATVLRGVEGFGASTVIHEPHALPLGEALPVVIVIVDQPERIRAFLPQLDKLIAEGLIVREPVDIRMYRAGSRR